MERQRKKRLNLTEHQWERVRAFVKQLFEEQPEQASKATYQSLIKEIQGQFPCFILSKSTFKKHVGRIEKLKANVGIQGEVEKIRKFRQRASEIFNEILIGLPPDEFECIQFDGLIQRAHELYPDLHITDRNKKTLAKHCPIKQLKARAREQRPGDAPAAQTVQTQEPADPAQALGAAAADIDGQRLAERQGQPDFQSAIQRQQKRSRFVFDYIDDSGGDDTGDVDADRASPPRANHTAASSGSGDVFGGDMVGAPLPAFPAAASTAKAVRDAETEVLGAAGALQPACEGLALVLAYDDSDQSSYAQLKDAEERILEHADAAVSESEGTCAVFAYPCNASIY
jgi:hypothetical protein